MPYASLSLPEPWRVPSALGDAATPGHRPCEPRVKGRYRPALGHATRVRRGSGRAPIGVPAAAARVRLSAGAGSSPDTVTRSRPGVTPPLPVTYTGDPAAPYGYDPMRPTVFGQVEGRRGSAAALPRRLRRRPFYTGHTGMALGQLFTCGGCGIWALIDGIMLLAGSDQTDAQGRVLRG